MTLEHNRRLSSERRRLHQNDAGVECQVRLRQKRPQSSNRRNLFARLPTETLRALWHDAAASNIISQQHGDENGGWRWTNHHPSGDTLTDIEFLPLEITFLPGNNNDDTTTHQATTNTQRTIYVSYNGGLLPDDGDNDNDNCYGGHHDPLGRHPPCWIELDESLLLDNDETKNGSLQMEQQAHATTVSTARVRILPWIQNGQEIFLEPLTPLDNEQFHRHASALEEGALLKQVSVVHHGQVLELWVSRRSLARARVRIHCQDNGGVEEDHGEDTINDDDGMDPTELEWPSSFSDEEEENGSHHNAAAANGFPRPDNNNNAREPSFAVQCRRLVADSRIVVLDPPVDDNDDVHQHVCLVPCPTWSDYGPSMRALAATRHVVQLPNPQPGTAWVHCDTAQRLQADKSSLVKVELVSNHKSPNTETQDPEATPLLKALVVRLVVSSVVLPQQIALHPWQAQTLQLDVTSNKHPVALELVPPWQVHQVTSRAQSLLESRNMTLKLRPVSWSTTTSPPFVWTSGGSGDDAGSPPPNDDDTTPFSIGSLIFWGGALYQLQMVKTSANVVHDDRSEEEESIHPRSSRKIPPEDAVPEELFLFGSNLHKWLPKRISMTNAPYHTMLDDDDESALVIAPCVSPPQRLNLLPEPTVIPTAVSSSSFFSYNNNQNILLLYGSSGSGKTHTALVAAALARFGCKQAYSTVYYDCQAEKDAAPQMEHLLMSLTDLVDSALQTQRPCVVILDDWDEICPNLVVPSLTGHNNSSSSSSSVEPTTNPAEVDQAKVVCDHVRNLLLADTAHRLVFVVTCRDKDSATLSCFHRQGIQPEETIALPALTSREKVTVLKAMLSAGEEHDMLGSSPLVDDATSLDRKSSCTSSLSLEFRLRDLLPKDLERIASRVQKERQRTSSLSKDDERSMILHKVLDSYIPLSRLMAAEEPLDDNALDWDKDIGGLFEAKQTLHDLVVRPLRFGRIYETARIRLPKGLLLLGLPGCGKSILPRALAQLLHLPLIVCRGPELLDRYIGASERKVRELFQRASLSAPSILFLDELDALAPHRGSDLTGVTDRVVNQLLTFLDGVEDLGKGKTVYVLAASSRPDKIDAALLRPGRLEKHVYLGPPTTQDEFKDVFVKLAQNYAWDNDNVEPFFREAYQSQQHDDSTIMSPADLKAVMDTAHIQAVQEQLLATAENDDEVPPQPKITLRQFQDALATARPSMPESERAKLLRIYRRFVRNNNNKKKSIGTESDIDKEDEFAPLRVALK